MPTTEPALVKLSAENLALRQRLAELLRENQQLHRTIGDRTRILDAFRYATARKEQHDDQ